jgi:hypothetical protein
MIETRIPLRKLEKVLQEKKVPAKLLMFFGNSL